MDSCDVFSHLRLPLPALCNSVFSIWRCLLSDLAQVGSDTWNKEVGIVLQKGFERKDPALQTRLMGRPADRELAFVFSRITFRFYALSFILIPNLDHDTDSPLALQYQTTVIS
jgi:hypothetical protein